MGLSYQVLLPVHVHPHLGVGGDEGPGLHPQDPLGPGLHLGEGEAAQEELQQHVPPHEAGQGQRPLAQGHHPPGQGKGLPEEGLVQKEKVAAGEGTIPEAGVGALGPGKAGLHRLIGHYGVDQGRIRSLIQNEADRLLREVGDVPGGHEHAPLHVLQGLLQVFQESSAVGKGEGGRCLLYTSPSPRD